MPGLAAARVGELLYSGSAGAGCRCSALAAGGSLPAFFAFVAVPARLPEVSSSPARDMPRAGGEPASVLRARLPEAYAATNTATGE